MFRLGTHTNSEGKSREWTTDDLDSMIAAFKSGIPEGIPLKLGHTSDEFTGKVAEQLGLAPLTLTGDAEGKGQAALGEVVSLTRHGDLIVADFLVPESLVPFIQEGHFTNVSSEILFDFRGHQAALAGVALLGAELPAVKGLSGLGAATLLSEAKGAEACLFTLVAPTKPDTKHPKVTGKKQEDDVSGENKFAEKVAEALHVEVDEEQALTIIQDAMESLGALAELLRGVEEEVSENAEPKEIVGAAIKFMERSKKASEKDRSDHAKEKDELTGRVTKLERDGRIASFKEETMKLTAVEGTPEDLAAALADTEDKMGDEVAKTRLAEWQKTQEYAQQAGLFRRVGSSLPGDPQTEGDAYLAEVDKYKADHSDATDADAHQAVMKAQPAMYRAYSESRKRVTVS